MPNTNSNGARVARVATVAVQIIVPLILGFCGLLVAEVRNIRADLRTFTTQTHAQDIRITAIEASRFTARDGQEVWQQLVRMKTQHEAVLATLDAITARLIKSEEE